MNKIVSYFRGVMAETRKVTWPTRKQVTEHSIIVISSVVIAMIVFGAIDFGLAKLLESLIKWR